MSKPIHPEDSPRTAANAALSDRRELVAMYRKAQALGTEKNWLKILEILRTAIEEQDAIYEKAKKHRLLSLDKRRRDALASLERHRLKKLKEEERNTLAQKASKSPPQDKDSLSRLAAAYRRKQTLLAEDAKKGA